MRILNLLTEDTAVKQRLDEKWTQKYKSSINCSHPKGFSQKAHCAGKKKHNESIEMEAVCPDCGMCATHGNSVMEVKQRLDAKCWKGKHKEGTKIKGGVRVNNCVPNESVEESGLQRYTGIKKYGKKGFEELQKAGREGADEEEKGRIKDKYLKKEDTEVDEAGSPAQQAAIAINMKKNHKKPKNESLELAEEFDMIERIIEQIADQHAIDAELVWEDLSTLTDDELYVFAVTSEPINEDWQKANKRDKTDGMSQKAVNSYRREHPGSKLKTAVTTKPSKLKKGGKASKRRKSYCSRSRGQMKMHSISCAKTPDKAICKARRRWNC